MPHRPPRPFQESSPCDSTAERHDRQPFAAPFRLIFIILLIIASPCLLPPAHAQQQGGAVEPQVARSESGGTLHPYQAAYDVQRYVLDLTVDPSDSTLAGYAETHAMIVHPTDTWRLALDPRFDVTSIEELMHKPEGGHLDDAQGRRVMQARDWTRPEASSK